MAGPAWRERFEAEIHRAESARSDGNEGQARVSARRAAGVAIREFLTRTGSPLAQNADSMSAFDLLELVRVQNDLSPSIRQIVDHLLQPVGPGGVFPADIDLIVEARRLVEEFGSQDPGSHLTA